MTTGSLAGAESNFQNEDPRPLGYFDAVYEAFLRAEQCSAGSADRFCTLAGRVIRVCFAGSALVPYVMPPLAHLATETGGPVDFTICVWDSASTGIPLPKVRLTQRQRSRSTTLGPVPAVQRIRTSFRGAVGDEREMAVISLLDTARRIAIQWVPSADTLQPWDRACPLLIILNWILDDWGVQLAHAAAVGTDKAGLVLTGKSGSGKSTTTVACVDYGLSFAGDDAIGLSTNPRPQAWSLYNSARLHADSLEMLPQIARVVTNPERVHEDKGLIFLHDHYPDQVRTCLPINAIVIPQTTGAPETRLLPASRAESLAALAPTSMFQVPDAGHRAFRALAEFARQVPSYRLEIGKQSSNAPHLLLTLLRDLGAGHGE